MRGATLLLALALAGCLGSDRIFPDETAKVASIRTNAYEKPGQDVVVEITGRDAQNVSRAFAGDLQLVLEEQHAPPDPPTYTVVATREVVVTADSFSNPGDAPIHVETFPRATLPGAGTYRISLHATLDGRSVAADPVLFYAQP